MDVLQVVAQLERVVRQSQNLPWFWSDRSVIHKERFLRLLAELHKALPEEIAQAQSLVERQNNLLESAKSEAKSKSVLYACIKLQTVVVVVSTKNIF